MSATVMSCDIGSSWCPRVALILAHWQFYHGEPKFLDRSDDLDKLLEIDRLADIAIDMKAIGTKDVFVCFRRGQHDNWNASEILIGFNLRQDLSAILLGQIEVKEDEIGRRAADMRAFPAEVGHRFNSIADHR